MKPGFAENCVIVKAVSNILTALDKILEKLVQKC